MVPYGKFRGASLRAPPTAPTNPAAVAGDSLVTLSWDNVSGASGYRVYRGDTAGGPLIPKHSIKYMYKEHEGDEDQLDYLPDDE
ncbi:MAG: hypothetical protein P8Y94_01060 [Acidobacteriota bacterium]